jgi:hypothetical protein
LAIPHEIPNAEKLKLVRRFCSLFVEKGLIADYAIHRPDKRGDRRNLHAHVMVTTRTITPEGWGEKFRVGENKMNDRREWLNTIRRVWEKICNAELQRIGSNERIDCRTLEEQGIDRHPQQHQGPIATAMERNGKTPDRKRTPIKQEFPQILITGDEINAAMNTDPRTRKITIRQNLLNVPPDKWQEEMKKFDRYKQQPPKPSDAKAVEQYRLICGAVADVREAKDDQAKKYRIEQNRKKAQGQNWDSGWER